MSHMVTKQCTVTDLDLLRMAAIRLGLACEENTRPNGWAGNQGGTCEMVIKVPGTYDLGVQKQQDGSYAWVCDDMLLNGGRVIGKNASTLMTQYGAAAVERDILTGAQFTTEVDHEGRIIYNIDDSELERLGYQINS